jgi:poly-gamma-glutamate capsule biosynthesis protein CapA/YwtB (metallophosphatase superfamily)
MASPRTSEARRARSPTAPMSATIGLLGDVMLGREVARRLGEGSPRHVWCDELIEVCATCDICLCNLECCISERGRRTARIAGKPFFFRAPPVAADALAAVRVAAVSLANNHALDYEEEALVDTLEHLAASEVSVAGAGASVHRARRGAVVPAGRLRVAFVAATDHPAEYAAGSDSPGVAWADLRAGLPDWIRMELARLRAEADLIVAFLHWGPNMTTEPARWQRRRARELVTAGADLVAGHSAHVFHGMERVEGRPILYDLGDALDDYAVDRRLRNDLGILVLWRPGADPDIELVGLRLGFCETGLARGADADWIAARLERACAELGTRVERVAEQRLVVRSPGPSLGEA